jgi:hypothetical protein
MVSINMTANAAQVPLVSRTHDANAVPQVSLTRVGCFDVNADGTIDTRSALEGGDATLLLPTHSIDLPTFARPAPSATPPQPTGPTNRRSTGATFGDATSAYRRYGDDLAPAGGIAVATPAEPAHHTDPQDSPQQ